MTRSEVLRAFDEAERALDPAERAAWLRFAVVGGGERGVALARRLAAFANQTPRRPEVTISLVEGGPRILPEHPLPRARRAASQLAKLGVDVWHRAVVVGADDEGLDIRAPRGEPVRLPARTVLWATAAPLKDLSSTRRTTRVTI